MSIHQDFPEVPPTPSTTPNTSPNETSYNPHAIKIKELMEKVDAIARKAREEAISEQANPKTAELP